MAKTEAQPVSVLTCWWVLTAASVRSALSYRGNFINVAVGSIALQGTQFLFVAVLLRQFESIEGWSFGEIALLYSMRLCSHAVCTVPFGQHSAIDQILHEGDFDRFLLRPVNPFVQLISRAFNPGSLGDLFLGIAVLSVAARLAPVSWSIVNVIFLIVSIVAGGLVEAGTQFALSSLAFRLKSTWYMKVTVDSTFADFGPYPMGVFGSLGTALLTFVLPLAFIAYLPATALLGRTDELWLPTWSAYSSFVIGPGIFFLGYFLFARQLRNYDSPGS